MLCQKSGQPVELCAECKAEKEKAAKLRGIDQVTQPANEVVGEHTQENAD